MNGRLASAARQGGRDPLVVSALLAGSSLAISLLAGSTIPLLVVLAGLLPWLVWKQWTARSSARVRGQVDLNTPGRLVLAVFVTSVIGGLAASIVAVVLNGLGIGGDGRLLLEALLAISVLTPAFMLGSRCRHWWAFSGSLPLCLLLAISPSPTLLALVLATGCSLALGSLRASRSGARHGRQARGSRNADPPRRIRRSADDADLDFGRSAEGAGEGAGLASVGGRTTGA